MRYDGQTPRRPAFEVHPRRRALPSFWPFVARSVVFLALAAAGLVALTH